MKDEKEIVWTEDMGFMPPVKKIEGRTICRVECQLSEYKEEIERLREALQLIAAPSKIIAKGEDMAVALQVLLSSHRQTALDA